MDDITLIINIQGFVLPNRKIAREIGWLHSKTPIGDTISVFTPDCELNEQEQSIVRKCATEIHGLRFKRTPNNKELWISNNDVKLYIQNLYDLYGGTFAIKGGIMEKEILEELNIPYKDLEVPKSAKILGPGCSLRKCMYYKNCISKNDS